MHDNASKPSKISLMRSHIPSDSGTVLFFCDAVRMRELENPKRKTEARKITDAKVNLTSHAVCEKDSQKTISWQRFDTLRYDKCRNHGNCLSWGRITKTTLEIHAQFSPLSSFSATLLACKMEKPPKEEANCTKHMEKENCMTKKGLVRILIRKCTQRTMQGST